MKISTTIGFNGDPAKLGQQARDLESAGVDLLWGAEIYGYDLVSTLGFLAGQTERVQLMTGIIPLYSRSPALIAQTAATLDALSGGRFVLGLGSSGPQVIEGWHGVPFEKPLGRTRDTIEICRKVWSGEKVTHEGRAYNLPLAEGGTPSGTSPLRGRVGTSTNSCPLTNSRQPSDEPRDRVGDVGPCWPHLTIRDPRHVTTTVRDIADIPFAGFVSTVDTTELRWFADGHPPAEVMSWFTGAGAAGMVEQRCDTYRLDGRCDVGVKRRFREKLELKVRQTIGTPLTVAPGLVGPLEGWRKWSPADGLAEPTADDSWVDVHKVVVKRRFSLQGDEIALFQGAAPMTDAGCDVEVVALKVDHVDAWTFAFAASGPTSTREAALEAAWQATLAGGSTPHSLETAFDRSSSYPEWLGVLTASGLVIPDNGLGRQLVS